MKCYRYGDRPIPQNTSCSSMFISEDEIGIDVGIGFGVAVAVDRRESITPVRHSSPRRTTAESPLR